MAKHFILSLFIFFFSIPGIAQESSIAQRYGEMITEEDLQDYLSILASDALEGRFTGSRGQKMAAAFIRSHFKEIGLHGPVDGSYYQPIELYTPIHGEIYAVIDKNRYENRDGIFYYGSFHSNGETPQEVVFVGKAREEDLNELDVEGKAALIMVDRVSIFSQDLGRAVARTREKGAELILIASSSEDSQFGDIVKEFEPYVSGSLTMTRPDTNSGNKGILLVSKEIMEELFNTSLEKMVAAANESPEKNTLRRMKPAEFSYQTEINIETVETENVLGYLEGSDKSEELIVVTAHYDHVGKTEGEGDVIYNGADDDGSGTSTVLQLAKVFAQAKEDGNGPRRSMLFMTVTGEEEGLFGSQHYVENPVFPLANTVVDLNIDMVGRTDPQHEGTGDYVYVIGSDKLSTELHEINESANASFTQMSLDYTYNDEDHPERLYYRSDHWNFAKNGVPIIFYFDGIHEDYHKVTDEVDKIEFDHLAKRAKLVFYTAWELANREGRITVDK